MEQLLNNPVFNALNSGDRHLGFGKERAKAFLEEVSPFAGFEDGYADGFNDLYELMPPGQYILIAKPAHIDIPGNWKLIEKVEGVQMIMNNLPDDGKTIVKPIPLGAEHVDEMMQLTSLTKPGPFGPRTIEFGHYFGLFDHNKLVAMAGQRMHVHQYSEISAVCTHPDYLGKGHATSLVRHQIELITAQNKIPFLHVRADNSGPIRIYERLGFQISRSMIFFFLQKQIAL